MTGGRGAFGRPAEEFVLIDLARPEQPARPPDDRSRTDQLAVVPAVEHGSARKGDCRDIDRRCRHDRRRSGLVATGGQHDRVDRIAVENFDQPEIGEVAVERGGRTPAILENRVEWELHRDSTGVADSGADAVGELKMDFVARGEVRARLGNADDGLARAQFFGGHPVVHETLEIERRHVASAGRGKPFSRTEGAGGIAGHERSWLEAGRDAKHRHAMGFDGRFDPPADGVDAAVRPEVADCHRCARGIAELAPVGHDRRSDCSAVE